MLDTITAETAMDLYTIIFRFNALLEDYRNQIYELEKFEINNKDKTLNNVFNYVKIKAVNEKAEILQAILDSYNNKACYIRNNKLDKYRLADIIPEIEEYKINKERDLILKNIKIIITDFMYKYKKEYFNNLFSQKDLSKLFPCISEKMMSVLLNSNGIRRKTCMSENDKKLAIELYREGKAFEEISEQVGKSISTLRKLIATQKKDEIFRNNLAKLEGITHNAVLEALGIALTNFKEISLYSEHITRYNKDIKELNDIDIFKNIDLIGAINNNVIFSVEVEINNNIEKSLYNLINYYKNAKLKVLYVTENKLEYAVQLRNKFTNQLNVKVYKIYEGFDRDFRNDVRRLLTSM